MNLMDCCVTAYASRIYCRRKYGDCIARINKPILAKAIPKCRKAALVKVARRVVGMNNLVYLNISVVTSVVTNVRAVN